MKTKLRISYETKKGYDSVFDKRIMTFMESIGGEFIGSGTSFFGKIPARDLEFEIDMSKLKNN